MTKRVTTAEWARQRLREAREHRAEPDVGRKLEALHRAYQFRPPAPAPDIEVMLAEIERGRAQPRPGPSSPRS